MEQHIQRYTKYIHEDLRSIDIDMATYKEQLHKSFEWFACIQLSIQFNSIFLCWSDIPPSLREEKGMIRDMGIDAWDMGNRVAQMKLYTGCISWRHFATFLACCDVFENPLKILYRNKESSVCDMIRHRITKHIITDINVSDLEFRSECKRINKLTFENQASEPVRIRPYQKEAIMYLEKGKEDTKNVYLCIPTGCGKTTIVLEYHIHHREELLLVLVPRIVLMEQWGEECKTLGIRCYLIGTGHHHNLDRYQNEPIVICVYDSIVNIYDQKDRFHRFVIDEAHHIKRPERYMDNELEHEMVYSDDEEEDDEEEDDEEEKKDEEEKVSYMKCLSDLKNRVIYLSATLDSPEDDSLFFEYKVRQAIDEGYLCDYQFVFPIFEQEYVTNEHLARYLVNKQHESHCVIYAPSCQEGQEFTLFLNQLKQGCAGYIDASTSYKQRKRLFADFESGSIQFLVNIRILVEGFNAPHIRSIFFLKVSTSEIFIIQSIGRALRQHKDKQIATIYVPFTHESDLERIQTFISQLASYDERVKKSIDQKKIGGYISMERGENDNEDEKEKKIEDEKVFDFRYNLVVDRMGESDQYEKIWMKRLEELKTYIDEYKKRPNRRDKDNIKLYNWIRTQLKTYKKNSMKEEKIRKIWEEFIDAYKIYFMSNEEIWIDNLEKSKKYIDENKKRPIEKLGWWIGTQLKTYKKKSEIMKEEKIRKIWEEFIDAYKIYFMSIEEIWVDNLEKSKKYINKNNKLPNKRNKNINIKELGCWLINQKINYKYNKNSMKQENIRKIWEEYVDKYKIYFMSIEEIWEDNLEKSKKYIDENKKRPDEKLGGWLNHQIENYKYNKNSMKQENIRKKWEEFVDKYKNVINT